jgi:hypothetical protein
LAAQDTKDGEGIDVGPGHGILDDAAQTRIGRRFAIEDRVFEQGTARRALHDAALAHSAKRDPSGTRARCQQAHGNLSTHGVSDKVELLQIEFCDHSLCVSGKNVLGIV